MLCKPLELKSSIGDNKVEVSHFNKDVEFFVSNPEHWDTMLFYLAPKDVKRLCAWLTQWLKENK